MVQSWQSLYYYPQLRWDNELSLRGEYEFAQRSLKFCPYITSVASKPKAHNVIKIYHYSESILWALEAKLLAPVVFADAQTIWVFAMHILSLMLLSCYQSVLYHDLHYVNGYEVFKLLL